MKQEMGESPNLNYYISLELASRWKLGHHKKAHREAAPERPEPLAGAIVDLARRRREAPARGARERLGQALHRCDPAVHLLVPLLAALDQKLLHLFEIGLDRRGLLRRRS